MFNSGILDVVVSLIFIYLLLSLVCTAVNEWIEGILKRRSVTLEQGIRELLNDEKGTGLTSQLYNHPLIYSLFRGTYAADGSKKHLPSYIPAKNFALALTDIVLSNSDSSDNPIESLRGAIGNLENEKVKGALMALVNEAGNDIKKARKNIEDWYDSGMDRVSGWYKRHVQKITITVAFIIAIAVNVDTITVATRLSYDVTMRQSLVAAAQEYAKAPSTEQTPSPQTSSLQTDAALVTTTTCNSPECRVSRNLDEIKKLGFPIGWRKDILPERNSDGSTNVAGWLTKILGWIITAFAVSLGAPFWFDMLNKIMVIRSTVKPHEKSPEEPAVDKENKLVLSLDKGEK